MIGMLYKILPTKEFSKFSYDSNKKEVYAEKIVFDHNYKE